MDEAMSRINELQMILRIQYIVLVGITAFVAYAVYLAHYTLFPDELDYSNGYVYIGLLLLFLTISIAGIYHFSLFTNTPRRKELNRANIRAFRRRYYLMAMSFEVSILYSLTIFMIWGSTIMLLFAVISLLSLRIIYPNEKIIRDKFFTNQEEL